MDIFQGCDEYWVMHIVLYCIVYIMHMLYAMGRPSGTSYTVYVSYYQYRLKDRLHFIVNHSNCSKHPKHMVWPVKNIVTLCYSYLTITCYSRSYLTQGHTPSHSPILTHTPPRLTWCRTGLWGFDRLSSGLVLAWFMGFDRLRSGLLLRHSQCV